MFDVVMLPTTRFEGLKDSQLPTTEVQVKLDVRLISTKTVRDAVVQEMSRRGWEFEIQRGFMDWWSERNMDQFMDDVLSAHTENYGWSEDEMDEQPEIKYFSVCIS